MTMQLERISFHDDLLWAGRDGQNVLVAVKPICDNLTLNWVGQLQRIKRDAILAEGMCVMHIPSPGGLQETVCLPLSLIAGWVFGIDDRRIQDPEVRAKVLDYKRECHAALYRHFFGNRHGHDASTFEPEEDDIAPVGTHRWLAEIALIRECRRIHGVASARVMWQRLGLPQVPEMEAQPGVIGSLGEEDVGAFLTARCTEVRGHRTRALDLWAAYNAWCTANGRIPTSLCMFGRCLSARFRKIKSGATWYIGVAVTTQ